MKKNKIVQTGGSINANILTIGNKANIKAEHLNVEFRNNEIKEITNLIDDLLLNLNASKENIKDKEDILSSFETIKSELNKDKPSKITIMSIGKTILDNLKYVTELAPFAHTIWDKIVAFIK